MRSRMIFAACAVLLLRTASHAAVPTSITVQGKLTDLAGTPLSAGLKPFTFRIFDAASFGTQIWPTGGGSENQNLTTDAAGLWIGLIGALSPLNDAVFADSVRWLEVSVSSTILPRIRLVTGPYTFRVATVDGASGGTITSKVSIGPGHVNTGINAFVAGENNTVDGDHATVGGGSNNHAPGLYSVIGGGSDNSAALINATVGGGALNIAGAGISTVSGGLSNTAQGNASTIGGGAWNRAWGQFATVAGGGGANPVDSNFAGGDYSAIGGGTENIASGWSSVVAGGNVNIATDSGATIGGGIANGVSGFSAVVSGGNSCVALGAYSSVGGGLYNYATDTGSVVAGGANNKCYGLYSTIGGGGGSDPSDSNLAAGWGTTIGGGIQNIAVDFVSTVGGGIANLANYNLSTVGGGGRNSAIGPGTTVSGGNFNTASGFGASVSGGSSNDAQEYGTVGGGSYNVATGQYSSIPGGYDNAARGDYSLAAGYRAKANHEGSFVWSDRSFQIFDTAHSTAPNQFIIRAAGGVGIGTYSPTSAAGGLVVHIDNASGPSALRLGTGLNSGAQWEWQSTIINGEGSLNLTNATDFTNPLTIDRSNNVGLSMTSPTNILTVKQSSATDPIADAWTTYSSRRWKTNISTITDPLGKVQRLRGVTYDWKADGKHDIGLIAEEVGAVIPEVVVYEDNGVDAKSVDYARLVALLIESVKEQQKQIDDLKSRLDRQVP